MQTMLKSKRKRKEVFDTVLYTLPAIVLVTMMMYIPFIMSGYYSLTKWNGIAKDAEFIGLDNFVTIFSKSKEFSNALIFTGKYTLLFIIFSNVLALFLAVCLTKKFKMANVLRGVFFIPYIMSMTIVGFIWKFIFTQGFARLADITGWGIWDMSWLGDPNLAFYSVVLVGVWQSLGFYIVLYIAGLQAVPADVLEAATVDGATGRQRFFKVTLPMLTPSLFFNLVNGIIGSLQAFNSAYLVTNGGPMNATLFYGLYQYQQAFQFGNMGYASAMAWFWMLIIVLLTALVFKSSSAWVFYQDDRA